MDSLFDFELDNKQAAQPVECLGMTFPDDEERRKYFLEKLREKLKDPEFRKIEGFPIGADEDILALSAHELAASLVCPHCGFKPGGKPPAAMMLYSLGDTLDVLLKSWTRRCSPTAMTSNPKYCHYHRSVVGKWQCATKARIAFAE